MAGVQEILNNPAFRQFHQIEELTVEAMYFHTLKSHVQSEFVKHVLDIEIEYRFTRIDLRNHEMGFPSNNQRVILLRWSVMTDMVHGLEDSDYRKDELYAFLEAAQFHGWWQDSPQLWQPFYEHYFVE